MKTYVNPWNFKLDREEYSHGQKLFDKLSSIFTFVK